MNIKDIFFLSSLDSKMFENTRKCTVLKKLTFDTGKECLLVEIAPGVINNQNKEISHLILAARHEGDSLFVIQRFPCFVHICDLLIPEEQIADSISKEDLQIIAWGELYRTEHDADNHIFD